jgi:hypothetical protein
VHVEAGLDGQPVLKVPDSPARPAANRVELGAGFRDLRQRGERYGGKLSDTVVKCLREVLIFRAGRRVLHT